MRKRDLAFTEAFAEAARRAWLSGNVLVVDQDWSCRCGATTNSVCGCQPHDVWRETTFQFLDGGSLRTATQEVSMGECESARYW
jgi:hypothetical protein